MGTVWPDMTIFERSWWPHFLQKKPKYFVTFGANLKNVTFKVKMLWLRFWATFYFSSGQCDQIGDQTEYASVENCFWLSGWLAKKAQ